MIDWQKEYPDCSVVQMGHDMRNVDGKFLGRVNIHFPMGNTKEDRIKFYKDMILVEEAITNSTPMDISKI